MLQMEVILKSMHMDLRQSPIQSSQSLKACG